VEKWIVGRHGQHCPAAGTNRQSHSAGRHGDCRESRGSWQ
jgi:hypothetical protein